jgi:threonylcarbamoyladenosine tRNA methylthiotransferase MtaB
MNSFSIQSFGCRVNQAEAFSWADEFQRRGLQYHKDHLSSDLILVNTCTITSRADRDVRNFLRRMHRENPGARLVVTGCMAERAAEELREFPGVWRVVSNLEKESLPACILTPLPAEQDRELRPFRSRALVKIQDGCDFACTFCVVPSVRGKSVSYDRDRILEDVRAQVMQGFQEVVLAGVHLTLYGRDLSPRSTFLSLLQDISALPGLHRLRLTSLDPRFMDQDLLDYLISEPRICPHFHLSLQHGSDRIIARMGRKIKTADYTRILDRLHAGLPRAALGTDIIVGFPGETDGDFETMETFLSASPLTYFHVFTFSPRPGTPAASWEQVPPEVKKDRAVRLRALAREKNLRFRRSFEGKVCEAVVISHDQDGRARVLTGNYIDVVLPGCPAPEKSVASIKIIEASAQGTRGEFQNPGLGAEE